MPQVSGQELGFDPTDKMRPRRLLPAPRLTFVEGVRSESSHGPQREESQLTTDGLPEGEEDCHRGAPRLRIQSRRP